MKNPKGYWTFEKCQEEVIKYEHKVDFIRKGKGAYSASCRNGWYTDITKHMLRKPVKNIYTKNIYDDYNVDHFQFFEISKPEVAYILGLIWADGNLGNNNYSVVLNCKYDDDINSDFNIFKKILEKTGKWNCYNYEKYDKRTDKTYKSGMFLTSNRYLYNHLIVNDFKEKSYVSPDKILSQIPDNLKHHFFRGYSDGDGCFYINKNSTAQFTVASTIEQDWNFMINISDILNINKYSIKKYEHKTKNSKSSSYRIVNKWDIIKLGEWLYKDSKGLRLERKYQKYLDIKNSDIKKASPKWIDYDINFLLENYKDKGVKYCMKKLNRSKDSIYKKYSKFKNKNSKINI